MSDFYAPPARLDIPPGFYQAQISSIGKSPAETTVLFVLTEPKDDDKTNPQRGLGGRVARAWFDLHNENPATREQAEEFMQSLKNAVGWPDIDKIDDLVGAVVNISVARVVKQSDPSQLKCAVVHFASIHDQPPEFVG